MLPNWLYGKSKSKLTTILGGGIPADYNQVKAQVTQNTDDVANITKQSGGLISYGVGDWVNNSATITLPRRGGLLVGGRNNIAFAIYVCENSNECAILSGSDFVTATISDLTLSLTFTRHYGTTFNYKYINSLVGQV